jgi:uncharacterized protein YwgA
MSTRTKRNSSLDRAAQIVRDAGGEVVGRTKLQKIACLLRLAGFEDSFDFEYRHYGPYSEELANSINDAAIMGLVVEVEKPTGWGGTFSIYTADGKASNDANRTSLIRLANEADSVVLELATTAAFLSTLGERTAWKETESRKPEKAKDRLENAKALYARLREIKAPNALPDITQ